MYYPVLNSNWLDNAFNDFFDAARWTRNNNITAPAINVKVNHEGYELEVAAPGMTKDDFHVTLDKDNNLVIKMEHKSEEKEGSKAERYLRREFSYANFEQALQLPDDVDTDRIQAKVEDGILHIALPHRVEKQEVRKNIEVA